MVSLLASSRFNTILRSRWVAILVTSSYFRVYRPSFQGRIGKPAAHFDAVAVGADTFLFGFLFVIAFLELVNILVSPLRSDKQFMIPIIYTSKYFVNFTVMVKKLCPTLLTKIRSFQFLSKMPSPILTRLEPHSTACVILC